MAFPQDPLEPDVSVLVDGEWKEVAAEVYTRSPIGIERGRANESSEVAPSKGTLVFDNRSGDWSPRNPRSPRYGKIGRNTPLRVAVPGAESYLALTGGPADIASTADATALDIVGDIDLRAEVTAGWATVGVRNLIGKWDPTTNQRSYILFLESGSLGIRWSEDGVANFQAPSVLPPLPKRAAVRVTMDVNNGASGVTVRFYTASSLDGPWAQYDETVITSIGTTSIFSSTAPLTIAPSTLTVTPPFLPLAGRVHRAEVRTGIGGTVVAAPDFRALTPGTTSYADSTGKTWTLAAGAEITNRQFRLHGEVPSWSPRWDVSGNDIETPVEVAGIMRRLIQGDKALASTLRRKVPTAPGVLAYWSMEESAGATQAYSPIPGVKPLKVKGLEFGAVDTLPSSSPLPTLKAPSSILGTAPAPPAGATGWNVSFVYRLDQAPAVERTYMGITGSGTVRRWAITFAASISRVVGYNADGDEVVNEPIDTSGDLFNQWVQVTFQVRQSGGSVVWQIVWRDVGGDAGAFSDSFTGSLGRCTGVTSPAGSGFHADLDGLALGHIAIFGVYDTTAYVGAVDGYAPETTLFRMARLTDEESNVPLSWVDGDDDQDSAWLGPQRPGNLMDLLQEAADADGGVLYENRDALALIYRDRATFYNQEPGLVLDYAADNEVAPPLEPTDDDKDVRNDRTVSRLGGSSGRVVIEEGPLSIQAPPLGVGVYDDSVTLNVYSDEQTEQIAAWRAHLGTWDEARYPSVHVNLAAAPHLIEQVLNLDIGDMIRINNLPEWMPPGPVDLIVQGYSEVIDLYAWDITFNCTPAGPWNVAVLGVSKADPADSVLAASVDADDTVLSVETAPGPQWVDASLLWEFPFDAAVGGETVTVTGITGLVQDTFARTVATGWGTATSGQTWTTTGGSTADYSVQGA